MAPRETGKTYLYRNISYYAHVLSGGKATPAQLFINLNTEKIGEVGTRDAVVAESQECLNRLSTLLSAIAALCNGQSGGVTLFQRDAASTTTTSVFTFCG